MRHSSRVKRTDEDDVQTLICSRILLHTNRLLRSERVQIIPTDGESRFEPKRSITLKLSSLRLSINAKTGKTWLMLLARTQGKVAGNSYT